MLKKFIFPTDAIMFGKYKGVSIGKVIETDKPYFDWMLKQDFEINPLLVDLRKGIDIVSSELTHKFLHEEDTLNITLHTFWRSKNVKGVRKSKQKTINRKVIFSYKSNLPFTTELLKWTEHIDCTKFHNDSIEVEKQETIYHYNQKDLQDFINTKLKYHGIL